MKNLILLIIILLFVITTFLQNKPNIIFFIADDMYPEMFNCLPQEKGKNLSPNLDRLAEEGVIMENQYVVSPRTAEERKEVLDVYNQTRIFRSMAIVNRDPSKPYSHFHVIPGGSSAEHASYGKYPTYFEADQLYNIKKDPQEQHNLATDPNYKEKLVEMKKELQEYLEKLPGKFDL